MSINTVHLLGNVGNDPELRVFESGNVSVQLSIACNEKYTNKQGEKVENTEWVNLVGYGKVAEVIDKYVKKGDPLYVEGKLRTRSYDAKDGTKRYITEVIVSKIELIASRKENSAHPPPENNYNPNSNEVKNNDVKPGSSQIPPEENDLPF
jgi:single-strand DNA-binding protein